MITKYDEELACNILVYENPLECVESLHNFFTADMWYAKDTEWKTEKDMNTYLKTHFDICINRIKELEKQKG